jgi:ketosteroid isomerase-like protein
VDAVDVVGKLTRVFVADVRDWSAMRALYHPDALLHTVTGGPDPLPADRLIAELERASRDTWYSVRSWDTTVVDERAVIVSGRMRRSVPGGGFEDASHVWLLTVRDGLIYRQGVYATPEEAAEAYQRLGVSLGIADAEAADALGEDPEPEPVRRWKPAPGEA